jgi:hypothetical protein
MIPNTSQAVGSTQLVIPSLKVSPLVIGIALGGTTGYASNEMS